MVGLVCSPPVVPLAEFAEFVDASTVAVMTDAIGFFETAALAIAPSSVTEHTTRELEEGGYPANLNEKAAE